MAERVREFLPWYSSVHRGAGYKSQQATAAYEQARAAALRFAGRRPDADDVAVICRNTTDAINHLAYRLRLQPEDVVATTVVEHHANLLPWARLCRRRFVECEPDGTFDLQAVSDALRGRPRPRLLAVTAASNVSGWLPPIRDIIDTAHQQGVPVLVDAAQLAAHRPLPQSADYLAWSGHKMYAPFGVGILIGPRATFAEGDPFLAGGGAVDLVDLDEVAWTDPPEREEAGSPNVVGAVALHAAIDELQLIGWPAIAAHDRRLARRLRGGLAGIDNVRLLGPEPEVDTLPLAAFTIDGVPHALVAARLSAEHGIGVRHGCFCAHPYLMRLLGLTPDEITAHRAGSAGRGPSPPARGGPGQRRHQHYRRRYRPVPRRGSRHRRWPAQPRRLPAGPVHRGLLAPVGDTLRGDDMEASFAQRVAGLAADDKELRAVVLTAVGAADRAKRLHRLGRGSPHRRETPAGP